MTTAHSNEPTPRKPLRLWPGVLAAALILLVRFVAPLVVPDGGVIGMLGGLAGGLAVVVWWLFFSRAPWSERLGAIALMVGVVLVTSLVVHESIANGMMGMMLPIFSLPFLAVALVAAAAAGRRMAVGPRRALMAAAIVLASGLMTLLRTDGITGDGDSQIQWRWTETAEERLLAEAAPGEKPRDAAVDVAPTSEPITTPETSVPVPAADEGAVRTADPVAAKMSAEWPGFRGPARDGVVRGVRIETDWAKTPPIELWLRPIGPGWSSFAVRGDLLYTQEQRGEEELVSCYRMTTGAPVWRHRDPVRFWESNGGAGPRATPTLSNGRVYTLGATGIVNALDARSGRVIWSRNAAADTEKEVPDWGLAGSPLVIDDVVIVAVAGRLIGYDARSGDQRWIGATGGGGYSSPHLATIGGVPQVLLLRGARTVSVAPGDGTVLWEHAAEQPAVGIVQPAVAENGDVLIAAGDGMAGMGIRRVAVARGSAGWTVEERWLSRGLKPYFNDFVVHEGHAYGFDGSILSAIALTDGERKWKGGRFGHGQLLLLPESDVLLVLSEEGELALVRAAPDQFTEVARFRALEGKTWNHPVLVGDILLVRNGEEMVAFRLPLAGRHES